MKQTLEKSQVEYQDVQVIVSHMPGLHTAPCLSSYQGQVTELPQLHSSLEEADHRMVHHIMHAIRNGTKHVLVLSSDSDVIILLLHFWPQYHDQGLRQLWVKAGIGDTTHHIPIHTLAVKIGNDVCKILPAVHTLTGCDYTSKFGTKHAAMKATPLQYLKDFSRDSHHSAIEQVFEKSEEYLTHVFKLGTKCKSMDELRNWMFHHTKSATLTQLPPTSHSIRVHMLQAFYATHFMVNLLHEHPNELDPKQFGYEMEDDLLMPTNLLNSLPDHFMQHCNCTKCATTRCNCQRHNIPCCKFCKCQSFVSMNDCKNPIGVP